MYYNDVPGSLSFGLSVNGGAEADYTVGTICCRLETKGDQTLLYLMTMGILAVSQYIASCMLSH